ncbi:unnamed protein product [Adineta ricciae]|nr:unnamed protein product [Adineta ricciae]
MLFISTMALSINHPRDDPVDFLFKRGLIDWYNTFVSKDSNKDKNSDSISKLSILKQLLSSSGGTNSNLDKLFQILSNTAEDKQNTATSSATKLDRLLGFFKKTDSSSSSSNNLQLALKLLNLAQGKSDFSSFNLSDLQSLLKFASG